MIGIAKRDLESGEVMEIPINLMTGELKTNDSINFIEGTRLQDLEKEKYCDCGNRIKGEHPVCIDCR